MIFVFLRRVKEILDESKRIDYNKRMFTVLYGNDSSRIDMKLEEIKRREKNKEQLDFDAAKQSQGEILRDLDAGNLFGEERLFVIRNADFLGKSRKENRINYDLKAFLMRKNDQDHLVFCLDQDVLSKRKEVKEFLDQCQLLACKALDQKNQKSYVLSCCKEANITMNSEALNWFCAHIGFKAARIHNEIEKLAIYSKKITLEDVKALVASEPVDDVFKMSDALFAKNGLRLIAFYRNFRAQNMETVQIIALLASQIRFLLQVRILMDEHKTKEMMIQELNAHPYRIKLMMEKAQNFSADELLKQLALLADLDYDLKSGKIDRDEGFENFALNLMESG